MHFYPGQTTHCANLLCRGEDPSQGELAKTSKQQARTSSKHLWVPLVGQHSSISRRWRNAAAYQLQQQQQEQQDPGEADSDSEELSDEQGQHNQAREEWMLLCSNLQQSSEKQEETQQSTDRTAAAQLYPNLEEAPHFVTRARRMLSYKYPLQLLILNAYKVSSDWCMMQFVVPHRQKILADVRENAK